MIQKPQNDNPETGQEEDASVPEASFTPAKGPLTRFFAILIVLLIVITILALLLSLFFSS